MRFVRDTVRVLEILGVFVFVFGADVGMPDRDTVMDSVLDTVTVFDVVGVTGKVVGILERVIVIVGVLELGADVGMPDRDTVTDGVFVFGADVGMPDRDTVTDRVLETVTVFVVVLDPGNVVGIAERVIVVVTVHEASNDGFTVTAVDGVSVTDRVLDTVIVVVVVGVTGKVVGILERVIVLVGVLVLGADVGMPDGETVTDRVLDTVTVFEVVLDPGKVVGIAERVIVVVTDNDASNDGFMVNAVDRDTDTDRVLDRVIVFVVVLDPGKVVGIAERVIVIVTDNVAGMEGITVTAGDRDTDTDRVLDRVIVFVVVLDPGKVVGIAERVIVIVGVLVLGADVGMPDGETVTDRVLDTVTVFEVVGVTGKVVGMPERVILRVTVPVSVAPLVVAKADGVTERVIETVPVGVATLVVGSGVRVTEPVGVATLVVGSGVRVTVPVGVATLVVSSDGVRVASKVVDMEGVCESVSIEAVAGGLFDCVTETVRPLDTLCVTVVLGVINDFVGVPEAVEIGVVEPL